MALRSAHAGVPPGFVKRLGIHPGSFNPPTTAHLAVSEAARRQRSLDLVVWSVSRTALAKERVEHPRFVDRVSVLREIAAAIPWLEVAVTDAQLLADVADGFDVLIMGADKWEQINQIEWYEDEAARTAALARLPELAIAPRPPFAAPSRFLLDLGPEHEATSSSLARAGSVDLILPEARRFAEQTGAWVDPDRYEVWVSSHPDPRP